MQVEINGNKIKALLKGKDVWLVLTPEEKVRQEYICRLVNHYGYSLDQMHQEVIVAEGNKRGTAGRMQCLVVPIRSNSRLKGVFGRCKHLSAS